MRVFIATLLLAGVGASAAEAQSPGTTLATVDPASRIEFALTTFWGQTLIGRFPQSAGEVVALPDGRRQVRLRLPTTDVEIVDYPRYTRFTRGPRFFDVARFPDVEFISDPYTVQLLHEGGVLKGRLRMHGVQHPEQFVLSPARCANPGRECDIVAQGTVLRANYDLDNWRMALRDEVRFTLHVRLRDHAASTGGQ